MYHFVCQAARSRVPRKVTVLPFDNGRAAAVVLLLVVGLTPALVFGQQWELVWADEFDADTIDATRWEHEVNGFGGGNNELQYYTDRNVNSFIDDGHLVIQARKESFTGQDGTRNYTSARLRTKYRGDWTYGRFEVRAKLPVGKGLWPAIWMLPTDSEYGGWAASGEIDIMEMLGHEPNRIYGTIHYGGQYPRNKHTGTSWTLATGDFSTEFHVFAVEWEPGVMRWYVDDIEYQELTNWYSEGGVFPAPFNRRFHLLLNVAVGGDWPGSPDASTSFPQRMQIDYVRVYEDRLSTPKIELLDPVNHGSFAPGESILLRAVAKVYNDNVAAVAFLQGEGVLTELTAPPFEYVLNNAREGCYEISARVEDDRGRSATAKAAAITVGDRCTKAPYLVAPLAVPGTIEAEYYDLGGPGVGYEDYDTANNGGAFRVSESVDIEKTTDFGGGFNVGWIEPGEWLSYSIDVAQAGDYSIKFRVASETTGGRLSLEVNGEKKGGDLSFGATGGWQTWTTVGTGRIPLDEGVQQMKIIMEGRTFNLNWVQLEYLGTGTAADADRPEALNTFRSFPNPCRGPLNVNLILSQPQHILLNLHDILGRKVATLLDEDRLSGLSRLHFALDDVEPGVYLVRVTGDEFRAARPLVLIR